MSFLFGQMRVIRTIGRAEMNCQVCGAMRPAQRLAESRYFTVFMIPILPLQRLSDYWECTGCGDAFASDLAPEPAAYAVIRTVLAYIMAGYGGTARGQSIREIFAHCTGDSIDPEMLRAEMQQIEQSGIAIFDILRGSAYTLNCKGKEQVVEAAFLMTHASCEIQEQDRVRINRIGGALGLSVAQVDEVLERVRSNRYYGVHRNLMPVSSVSR